MRILFIIDDFHVPDVYAGTAVNTHYLVQCLAARGHFVAVAARRDIDDEIFCDRRCGYPLFVGPDVAAVTRQVTATYRFDVTINQNRGLWPVVDPFALDDGPLRVFYEHTVLSRARMPPPQIRGRALCLTNSTFLSRRYALLYGVGSIVVPPIYGIDRFGPLEPSPRHVTMISVQHSKGTDIALHLARQRPDIEFVVVESWKDGTPETERLRQQLAAQDNVRLLANQPDLGPIYAGTGVLLMPSRVPETWGRAVTECQLLGIPVLGSDRGNLPDTIGPGGLCLDPDGDLAQWTTALALLWDRSQDREAYGAAARNHARLQIASIDEITQRLEFLLAAAAPSIWPATGDLVRSAASEEDQPPLMPARGGAHLAVPRKPDPVARVPISTAATPPTIDILRPLAVSISRVTGLALEPDCMLLAQEAVQLEQEAIRQVRDIPSSGPGTADFSFVGRHRIRTALANGRGVILCESPMAFSRNVLATALRAARYRMVRAIASGAEEFPVSLPAPGLQPAAEDSRHEETIALDWRRTAVEMHAAKVRLQQNELLVASPVTDLAGEALELPFSSARLRINLGPFRLAHLTGAVLLPVSCARLAAGAGYEVRVGEPIGFAEPASHDAAMKGAVAMLAAWVAQDLIRHPSQWLGWDLLIHDFDTWRRPDEIVRNHHVAPGQTQFK